MNIYDVGIVLFLILGFIIGFKHGVIRQLVSLIGIIIIFIIAFLTKGIIGNFLCTHLPFFNFIGPLEGLTTLNIIIYQLIAFLLIFIILLFIFFIIVKVSKVLEKVVDLTIILWLPSKLLGGLVCLLETYILIFILLVFLSVPLSTQDVFKESKLVNKILYETPLISDSKITKSIKKTTVLVNKISKNNISKESANKEILIILIENKIVDIDTINTLNDQNKLKIKGLKKY